MLKTLTTVFTKRTNDGTTERLLQLAFAYFATYIATGIAPKYFLNSSPGYPAMSDVRYLVYSTTSASLFCIVLVMIWKWHKFRSQDRVTMLGLTFPREFLYIAPSGVCTAVIIPTTTLMYLLPISVMVAMILMRASVIVICRIVDTVQIHQGILTRKVYWQENMAVVFALAAVSLKLTRVQPGDFDFIHNPAAMAILASYVTAYAVRIYIMNYFKNTRPPGIPYDNKGFFAIEQISACITMAAAALVILFLLPPDTTGPNSFVSEFRGAFTTPHKDWMKALLAGIPFGIGAFFSVFLFMFKGRTATFAGLVNRLTSLVAGTMATLIVFLFMAQNPPAKDDWLGLLLILIAIYFLGIAEKRRACELARTHEIVPETGSDAENECRPGADAATR